MGRYQEVEDLITGLQEDFSKFYEKDNQAAGTRIRKGMQELKKIAQEIRTEVQETKNKRAAETKK
ncbi:histone H1 [Bernardetia sp.]|uniref:histone H1 n=1 Tax=Bernardetia sp. TaxID=1937974 RepID=UPI0025B8AED6|nr:histone H1 [Bernardetia sp.]